ncbi:MAG TPA: hypothetical protein VKD22_17495, partial [Ramlibacter sp.]|nr:hypothetical protein [Ramlibacter sp.]
FDAESLANTAYSDKPPEPAADAAMPTESSASYTWAVRQKHRELRVGANTAAHHSLFSSLAGAAKMAGEGAGVFKQQAKENPEKFVTPEEKEAERRRQLGADTVLMIDGAKALADAAAQDVRQKSDGYVMDLARAMVNQVAPDANFNIDEQARMKRLVDFMTLFVSLFLRVPQLVFVHGATHALAELLNSPWDEVDVGTKARLYTAVLQADASPLPTMSRMPIDDGVRASQLAVQHAMTVMQRFGSNNLPAADHVAVVLTTANPYALAPHSVAEMTMLDVDEGRFTDIVGNQLTLVTTGDPKIMQLSGPATSPILHGRNALLVRQHLAMDSGGMTYSVWVPA